MTLDQFVTTASPFPRNRVDVAQSTTVLSGHSLLHKQQATLGETLAGEIGMSATSFGPGASRPIIRGLGGDRIRLLENGVGTIDASVASPDHAVSVEPFLVERVEIVRGPASLLYGSSAVGGVVNVITHRIETELPTRRARGGGELRFGGAAGELARGAQLDLALPPNADRALVLHADAFRRSTENLRIPGFAESARLRVAEAEEAEEHGQRPPEPARDRLPNSALESEGAAGGLTFLGRNYHLGVSYSGFDTNYGVPGHAHEHAEEEPFRALIFEGVRIDLRQRRLDAQGEWRNDGGAISAVRFKFGRADYEHVEREPEGTIGSVFTNRGHDGRFEVMHADPQKKWNGALGVQTTSSRLAVTGAEAFLPPSQTRTGALFVFEEVIRDPITWQLGARFERAEAEPDGGAKRRDDELSGSLGAIWKLDAAHSLAWSIAHTGRAPNPQELFAYGPHAGTQAFEIGDPTLAAEKSLGLEVGLRRKTGLVTGTLSVFANRFRGYIFEQPTGSIAVEGDTGWELLPPGPDIGEREGALPVFRSVQRGARFWGVELDTLWHLHESPVYQLDLKLATDMTRARENGRNLPRIPAARTIVGLAWAKGAWAAEVESQFVLDQRRVAPGETTSDGYTLVSAAATWTHTSATAECELFARVTNLADADARPHTSFLKELAPLGGRGITLGARLTF